MLVDNFLNRCYLCDSLIHPIGYDPHPLPPAGMSCDSASAQIPNISSSCMHSNFPPSPLALTRLYHHVASLQLKI